MRVVANLFSWGIVGILLSSSAMAVGDEYHDRAYHNQFQHVKVNVLRNGSNTVHLIGVSPKQGITTSEERRAINGIIQGSAFCYSQHETLHPALTQDVLPLMRDSNTGVLSDHYSRMGTIDSGYRAFGWDRWALRRLRVGMLPMALASGALTIGSGITSPTLGLDAILESAPKSLQTGILKIISKALPTLMSAASQSIYMQGVGLAVCAAGLMGHYGINHYLGRDPLQIEKEDLAARIALNINNRFLRKTSLETSITVLVDLGVFSQISKGLVESYEFAIEPQPSEITEGELSSNT